MKPPSQPSSSRADSRAGARRLPTQDRSRQRVERILEAAAEVFAEAGYDAATTEAIALRAGTSIGSLYQFFPNKLAVFTALAHQYLDRARLLFEASLTASEGMTWEELIDQGIDAFDLLQRTQPAFRAVWQHWLANPEFLAAGAALNKEFAKRVEKHLLATRAPALRRAERELVATMIIEVISAMLFVSVQIGGDMGARMVAETKVLLKRYLAPLAVNPGESKPRKRAR